MNGKTLVQSDLILTPGKRKRLIRATPLDSKIKKRSGARRMKIEAGAARLIAEEMALRNFRKALKLSQERVAETLKIRQEGVSRLEKRGDLLLSTLRSDIEAMGGSLSIVATFPDRQPIVLAGLAAMDTDASSTRRRHETLRAPNRPKRELWAFSKSNGEKKLH